MKIIKIINKQINMIKDFKQFTTDELYEELKRREELEKQSSDSKLDPLTVEFIIKIKEALKQFGEYSLLDKGVYDVMNTNEIKKVLSDLEASEVALIFSQILDSKELKPNISSRFVSDMISELDDREDFDELFDYDDRFDY